MTGINDQFKDKIILVTGGTGTVGSALVEEILTHKPKQLRILSRDENKQYYLMEKLRHPSNVRFFIGDIRDKTRLERAFEKVDILFHAAALKHVPLCEYNPFEAVQTNIVGSQNVIDAAMACDIKKIIAISTDKAVHPNNVMGTTKLMMEKLFVNANYYSGLTKGRFSCVRFGNVAWASGSVLRLWKNQVERNNELRITNPDMTRFFMSITQAMKLVINAAVIAQGGEIFILKMPSVSIGSLANLFLEKYYPGEKIKKEVIGARPGEKMHEELLDGHFHFKLLLENKDMIVLVPDIQIEGLHVKKEPYQDFSESSELKSFSSEDFINEEEIKKII